MAPTPTTPADSAQADSAAETAALDPQPPQKKQVGRPRGAIAPRVRTIKFDVEKAVARMSDLASRKTRFGGWDWDGKMYPKTKRSQGPHQEAL